MAVYLITGASRGLGFEFVKQLSENSKNLVLGLVRNKTATEKKVAEELQGRDNVRIIHGDLSSHASLKKAAAEATDIVGERGIDYLVANGAYLPLFDAFDSIDVLGEKVEELEAVSSQLFQTSVVGNIHLFNLFIPLVLKGKVKKVIALSSGHGDLDLINDLDIENAALYAASKAALNVVVAKFSARYKRDGVLFVSISPGVVAVDHGESGATPEQLQSLMVFMGKIQAYAPHFKGPVPVEEGAAANIAIWEKVSVEAGYGGAFVSHLGNKQWV